MYPIGLRFRSPKTGDWGAVYEDEVLIQPDYQDHTRNEQMSNKKIECMLSNNSPKN